ncbi:MAG: signal peptidase II [Aestuariivirgaceae bacterium]|nr:signal peptidase II [Aestuariivirgaceae bacterium]
MARPPVKIGPVTGPLTALGLALASLTFGMDQLHKWWMLGPYDIASKGLVTVTPFFDLVLAWNRGVSYGWFAQHSEEGQIALVVVSLIITGILWLWLARVNRPLTAAALGLVIGGALGNALDRVVHGAVADFFLLHAWGYNWYVFNVADMAIVAGVGLLLYESHREGRA